MLKKSIFIIAFSLGIATLQAQNKGELYIIGGATPNNWSNDGKAAAMITDKCYGANNGDGVFRWKGNLKVSDFKFISYRNTWSPAFNATTENEEIKPENTTYKLAYNANGENDYKFVVKQEGNYTIEVDMDALTMDVTYNGPVQKSLWLTGEGAGGNAVKLDYDDERNFFLFAGQLEAGTVKFRDTEEDGESTNYYVPTEEDLDIRNASDIGIIKDANRPGWVVNTPGDYKIKIESGVKVSVEKMDKNRQLFIIGGCTDAGWDAANAIPFVQNKDNPYVYVFEGTLKENQGNTEPKSFKILGQRDWGPYSLHPYSVGEQVLGSKYVFETGYDYKWDISQDGKYRITVDLQHETMTAELLN